MTEIIAFIVGAGLMYAYQRGMLDTPIAAAIDWFKAWGKK